MKSISGRLIICLISITASFEITAQDINATLNMARQSLQEQRYEDAAELYRRVIYFDNTSQYDTASIEGLAVASFYLKDFDQAAKYFLVLHRQSLDSKHYFYHILALLSQDKVLDAKRASLNLADTTTHLRVSKKIFLGLMEFRLSNFESSRRYFDEVNQLLGIDDRYLNDVLSRASHIDRKNKITAVVLSGILPGLGQAYTGHYKEGANSFVLMSVFGVVYVYSLINLGPVDAIISILPWFHRYYVGGMNAAASMVDNYKEEQWSDLYNELVTIYSHHIY